MPAGVVERLFLAPPPGGGLVEVSLVRVVANAGIERKGVATTLIRHVLDEARRRSYRRLSLETGSMEAFAAARSLYAKFGFEPCGPFAQYVEDPYSVFMTREV